MACPQAVLWIVKVGGKHFRTIWRKPDDESVVQLIDQRFLPHDFVIEEVATVEQMATAIREMHVRGAGLIGASAGYGMYLAALEAACASQHSFDERMTRAANQLRATRPTAVNLSWARRSAARRARAAGRLPQHFLGDKADGVESFVGNRASVTKYRHGKNYG